MTLPWQESVVTKLQQRDARIPRDLPRVSSAARQGSAPVKVDLSEVLEPRQLELTNVEDVSTILSKLATGEWTALETIRAFCIRALAAHDLTNCLTEVFFDKALERAAMLDRILQTTGKVVGPLHGLPISLKDQIEVAGEDCTMGYVGWIGKISARNAVLVDVLLEQGAVLYCRTNVPQSLMSGETNNAVFGTTTNPFDSSSTCGGSSGGEGALIGMRGSLLGVGSDIGGSIRVPAAFQGLYGLRPSYYRVPYHGSTNSMLGQEAVPSVLGPISASRDGLKIFLQAVIAARPWTKDAQILRLPWREEAFHLAEHGGEGAPLCFALMLDDGLCRPEPPIERALLETKAALEAAGHTVITWEARRSADGLDLISRIFNADGGKDTATQLALSGEPRLGWMMNAAGDPLDVHAYHHLIHQRSLYVQDQLSHWQATVSRTGTGRPVDAILAPASAVLPPPHGRPQHIWYTSWVSLCDLVAAVLPVTVAHPDLDVKYPRPSFFRTASDARVWTEYVPERCRGLPVGIQLIGAKGEEEAVLRMLEIVDDALKAAGPRATQRRS